MINELSENEVFVFGSNLAGFHGGGAARAAMNRFGAVWGQGVGGFRDKEIAPLFAEALEVENIILPKEFVKALQQ